MSGDLRVVVVGGGAAGCAAAYYLSAAGARVTIVEREGIGNGASGWSAGGLNPLQGIAEPILALAMESYRLHLELWPELERLGGERLDAGIIAMAYVAPDEAAAAELRAQAAAYDAATGFSARWVGQDDLLELEPRLAPRVTGALLTRGNAILDSLRFTRTLAEAARALGATVVDGRVTGVAHDDRRVTGVLLDDAVLACDAAVVAMGPWSGAAATWLGVPVPVVPLKGEIVRMRPSGPPLPFDIVAPGISLFQRPEGQIWLASTHQQRGFDREPSDWGYRTLFDAAVELMPSIEEASLVRQTACLRPIAPDDLPIVGGVPGWRGAFVATAGGTKGILLAPAMGRAVANLVLTGETALSIAGAGLERFMPAVR